MEFNGNESYFSIDDTGGTERDLSQWITDLDDIPGKRKLVKSTALGATGETWITGLEDQAFDLKGQYDDTSTTGPDAVLGPLRTHTSAVDWVYGPTGNLSGSVKYSGTCWLSYYAIRSRENHLVEWKATIQIEGAITRGTFA